MRRFAVFLGALALFSLTSPQARGDEQSIHIELCESDSDDTCLLQVNLAAGSAREIRKKALTQHSLERHGFSMLSAASFGSDPLHGQVHDQVGARPYVDWLYTSSPKSCAEPVWDVTEYAPAIRLGLPILYLVLIGFVILNGSQEADAAGLRPSDHEETEELVGRRHDLDYARIIGVACVVTEHSGGSHWSQHNVLFALQWVLPFLYITSAIAWMMSKKSVGPYILRLFVVLCVGVAANWIADCIIGRDWQHDFGNTIFQMFYVVMLIAMSLVTVGLRQALGTCRRVALKQEADPPAVGLKLYVPMMMYGLITAFAFVGFWCQKPDRNLLPVGQDSWLSQLTPVINEAPIAFIQIGGALFLAHLACLFRANDIFPWLLLVHIFLPRIFIPWLKVGFFHNLELFVFAMVAHCWKLKGQRIFQRAAQNYWPILIFFCMIAMMPDAYGRCDLTPPATWHERLRFYGIELCFCLFLVTGSFKVGDPYRVTEWLNYWALYAYCFHVAWARLFPIPYGALLTYSSAAVVYLAWHSAGGKSETAQSSKGAHAIRADSSGTPVGAKGFDVADLAGGG